MTNKYKMLNHKKSKELKPKIKITNNVYINTNMRKEHQHYYMQGLRPVFKILQIILLIICFIPLCFVFGIEQYVGLWKGINIKYNI